MRRRTLLGVLGFAALGGSPSQADRQEQPDEEGSGTGPPDEGVLARNREAVIGAGAVAALGGLALLAYKIRTADPESAGTRQVSGKLERQDLMAGGEPANALERIIQLGNDPLTYVAAIAGLLGLGALLEFVGIQVLPVIGFGVLLLVMHAFLRFGWPHVEAFHERESPAEADPDSMRFEGFSTDTKVFLTLFVAVLVLVLGLILLESTL